MYYVYLIKEGQEPEQLGIMLNIEKAMWLIKEHIKCVCDSFDETKDLLYEEVNERKEVYINYEDLRFCIKIDGE